MTAQNIQIQTTHMPISKQGWRHVAVLLICGALATSLLTAPTAAVAVGRTCTRTPGDPYTNYFDGRQSASSTSVRGVRARIEYNNPELCGIDADNDGFSVVWVMMAAASVDPDAGDLLQFAQAGYGQFGGSTPGYTSGIHTFSAFTYVCYAHGGCGGGAAFRLAFGPAPGGTKYYSSYIKSDGLIHMYAGSTELDYTNFNPSGDWSDSHIAQFYGETLDTATDVPGVASNHCKFDYMQKYSSSQNWVGFSNLGDADSSHSRYKHGQATPSTGGFGLQIWTDPL